MKRLILLVVFSLISLTINAQGSDEGTGSSETSPMMQEMQGRMQAMREQMENIQATENMDERERLMREHMSNMHEGMQMMSRMMARGMSPEAMPNCQDDVRSAAWTVLRRSTAPWASTCA